MDHRGLGVKATWVAVGVGGSLAMMIINYFGVTTAALIQKVVTAMILLVGVLFVTGALFEGETINMMPLFTQADTGVVAGIVAVLVMVPFLFVGFDVIPQAAAEINLPYKAIGKVLMMSVILAVVWYALMILATSLALNSTELAASSLSVPDAMGSLFNAPWASNLMVLRVLRASSPAGTPSASAARGPFTPWPVRACCLRRLPSCTRAIKRRLTPFS